MMEHDEDRNGKPTDKMIELPFKRHVPEGITTQYANHFVVQAPTGEDFYFSFFEAVPPDTLDMPEDEIREKIKNIRATCIARIVVSRKMAERIIKAIQTTLAKAREDEKSSEAPEGKK